MGVETDVRKPVLEVAPIDAEPESGERDVDHQANGLIIKDPALTRRFIELPGGRLKRKPDRHVRGEDDGHDENDTKSKSQDRREAIIALATREEMIDEARAFNQTFTITPGPSDSKPKLFVVRDGIAVSTTKLDQNGKTVKGGLEHRYRLKLNSGEITYLGGGRTPIAPKNGSR